MKKSLVCGVLLIILAGSLVSQQFVPPQPFVPPSNQNAALRYWMSFADLVDRPTDEATNKAIDDVLSGAAAWDEQKLGPIVDANEAAVRSLQRATKLSECNWGLEYDRGFAMSLGHLPKARVIARLNALYGARQLAKGDAAGAVDTWLAGLRFAQHVGEGVSLIGTLSAPLPSQSTCICWLEPCRNVASMQNCRRKSGHSCRSCQPTVWIGQAQPVLKPGPMKTVSSILPMHRTLLRPIVTFSAARLPPASWPPHQDIAAFHGLMTEVIAAFQLPAAQTKDRLLGIMAKAKELSASSQAVLPNYQRTNDARIQVASEKEALLQALK